MNIRNYETTVNLQVNVHTYTKLIFGIHTNTRFTNYEDPVCTTVHVCTIHVGVHQCLWPAGYKCFFRRLSRGPFDEDKMPSWFAILGLRNGFGDGLYKCTAAVHTRVLLMYEISCIVYSCISCYYSRVCIFVYQ